MLKNKSYSLNDAKAKMEYFCAYQERCHKEVREKLRDMKMIPEAIDLIVVHLIENNYMNEQRFAEQFTLGKFRIKKWGKQRIRRELKQRDISSYNLENALKLLPEVEYLETLEALVEKRMAAVKETNTFKRKKKICDYLLYRGWESHLVYEMVTQKLSER